MKQHIILWRDNDSSFKIVTLHLTDLLKWVPVPPKQSCATSNNKGNKNISGMGTETLVCQDDVFHFNFAFPCDEN